MLLKKLSYINKYKKNGKLLLKKNKNKEDKFLNKIDKRKNLTITKLKNIIENIHKLLTNTKIKDKLLWLNLDKNLVNIKKIQFILDQHF